MEANDTPRVLSLSRVAKELGVCPATARKIIARGDLRSIRVGHQIRVPISELDRYITGEQES
jgi:excisionase family DNA binding protein